MRDPAVSQPGWTSLSCAIAAKYRHQRHTITACAWNVSIQGCDKAGRPMSRWPGTARQAGQYRGEVRLRGPARA
jgi:hypothetical protein